MELVTVKIITSNHPVCALYHPVPEASAFLMFLHSIIQVSRLSCLYLFGFVMDIQKTMI